MWDKEVLKSKLERLKFIKNAASRSIEFWCPTYLDTQNTKFKDNPLRKDDCIDAIIDAAILYLEDKLQEE
jgi:hypothetical protein